MAGSVVAPWRGLNPRSASLIPDPAAAPPQALFRAYAVDMFGGLKPFFNILHVRQPNLRYRTPTYRHILR